MNAPPIVCPFCCLHCDDVQVDSQGRVNVDCQLARDGFASASQVGRAARIGSRAVTGDEALDHAAKLLRSGPEGRRWVTTGTPLTIARQLARMRSTCGVEISIDESETRAAMRTTVGRDGYLGATLGDIRRHADVIWFIGNCELQTPRLKARLGGGDRASQSDRRMLEYPRGISVERLAQAAASLRGGDAGDDPELESLANTILGGRYVAVVLADNGFATSEALVAAELLVQLVSFLNDPAADASRRAVLLSMDSGTTTRSVIAWHSNDALTGSDSSHAIRIGNQRVGAATAVALQIGGSDPGIESAHAFVPTGTAGVHHADVVIRGDSSVTLPMDRIVDAVPLSQLQWLQSLEHRVAGPAATR